MISFVNVYKKYTKEFFALSNVSFKFEKGEVVALVGPVDSGKTCILRILAGIETPDKGEVYIKNIPVQKVDYLSDVSMGYIPYKANFFDKKTVYDNLKYVLNIRKIEKNVVEEKVNDAIIDFRLEGIAQQKVFKLSLFQKYVVSVARLSFRKLDVVLIDNIFEELTPTENKELIKLFKKYFVKPNTLVIIATSDGKLARSIATRVVHINYGVIDKID
jgi:ABC-type multidrug transport system ATPase subunit